MLLLGGRHRNRASARSRKSRWSLRHLDRPRIRRASGPAPAFSTSTPTRRKPLAGRTAQLQGEYRFGDVLWIVAPFVGLMGTSAGAFYGYAGFGFDMNFGPNWVVTPTFAGGYWYRGDGTNLGSWWEFRSGAEFDYRFDEPQPPWYCLLSHVECRPDQENPGEQALLLVYTVPLR